jgi:hypothetical protein
MSEQEYYIVTTTQADGCLMYWRPKECGYTRYIELAGRYSEDSAKKIVRMRTGDDHEPVEYMIPCELIEKEAMRVVDYDRLESFSKVRWPR